MNQIHSIRTVDIGAANHQAVGVEQGNGGAIKNSGLRTKEGGDANFDRRSVGRETSLKFRGKNRKFLGYDGLVVGVGNRDFSTSSNCKSKYGCNKEANVNKGCFYKYRRLSRDCQLRGN